MSQEAGQCRLPDAMGSGIRCTRPPVGTVPDRTAPLDPTVATPACEECAQLYGVELDRWLPFPTREDRYGIRVWLRLRTPKGVLLWGARCQACGGKVLVRFARTPGMAADVGRDHLHREHGWR